MAINNDENVKLNVEELVKEYTSTTNDVARKMFMEKIQVKPYISYSAKMIYANRIVESTSWDESNGKVSINSPIRHVLYVYTLINAYTNIDMDNENMLAEYDALSSSGLKEKIISKIPEAEKKEFDYVLKMVTGDYYANHFETHAYIDSLVDRLRNIVENFLSPISEGVVEGLNKLSSEEIADAITTAVSQVGNKNEEPKPAAKKTRTKKVTKKDDE